MRSLLYRFSELLPFEQLVSAMGEPDLELGLPPGETAHDGEWVLAVFEVGSERRTTSAAARATQAPDGTKLVFEPRDWDKLADFAQHEARRRARAAKGEVRRGGGGADGDTPTPGAAIPAARSSVPWRSIGAGATIMIVDDDPDIRDVVTTMLEAVGFVACPVGSAEEALTRLKAEPCDLLVVDWNLPKMTGIDLCRLLREEQAYASMPILFLTAHVSSADMVEAFESGADDYVVKPFRAPELEARIFSLLRRARRSSAF